MALRYTFSRNGKCNIGFLLSDNHFVNPMLHFSESSNVFLALANAGQMRVKLGAFLLLKLVDSMPIMGNNTVKINFTIAI